MDYTREVIIHEILVNALEFEAGKRGIDVVTTQTGSIAIS